MRKVELNSHLTIFIKIMMKMDGVLHCADCE